MQRTHYASTMLRWLGYTASDRLQRDFVTCQTCWQVTAEGEENVIIARARDAGRGLVRGLPHG